MNGKALSFLIDTGAAVTLIHKDAWDNMQRQLEPWAEVRLVGVDGSPLTVHGQARVDISLHGHSYPTRVVVVSPLTTEAILGLDFLQERKASINFEKAELSICQQPPIPLEKPPRNGNDMQY